MSWARAEQTGYRHPGDAPLREPRFDVDRVRHLLKTIEEHNTAWRDWFATFDIRPHREIYEELIADMVGVTPGVLVFLGLEAPAEQLIASAHRRQADELTVIAQPPGRRVRRPRRSTAIDRGP